MFYDIVKLGYLVDIRYLQLTLWWSIVAAAAKGDGGKPGGAWPRKSMASAKLCPEGATLWFISGDSIII